VAKTTLFSKRSKRWRGFPPDGLHRPSLPWCFPIREVSFEQQQQQEQEQQQ
jgi:hypothetical protein